MILCYWKTLSVPTNYFKACHAVRDRENYCQICLLHVISLFYAIMGTAHRVDHVLWRPRAPLYVTALGRINPVKTDPVKKFQNPPDRG